MFIGLRVWFQLPWQRGTQSMAWKGDLQQRMEYVANIAKKFNRLMNDERSDMEKQLQTIQGWHVG